MNKAPQPTGGAPTAPHPSTFPPAQTAPVVFNPAPTSQMNTPSQPRQVRGLPRGLRDLGVLGGSSAAHAPLQ
uniref:Uncharacterized protein n=1 Tax=Anas platyrhynchos platyrhynchos TaxID=8840 RepID=A0A493TCB5_ANAPP